MTDRKNIFYQTVNGQDGTDILHKGPKIGVRYIQAVLLFIGLFVAYAFRVCLSIAIVAMTDPKASINPDIPTYPEWKNTSVILSAFFWGYIIPQVFAGWAANKYGAKWFLTGAIALHSITGILIPVIVAHFGSTGLIVSRALQGFTQAFLHPCLTELISQWAPQEERARLNALILGAMPLSTVASMFVTGVISSSWYGWPMAFYLLGGMGLAWCTLFAIFGSNSPKSHSSITKEEKNYILTSLGKSEKKVKHITPWKAILTSRHVWAIFIAQCAYHYTFWTVQTQIAIYISRVMKFNIKDNGILSALPYLTCWLFSIGFGFIADHMVNKKIISIGTTRKLFTGIGFIVPATALVLLGYTRSDQTVQAVILLVTAVGVSSASVSGWALNFIDLSPNFAATLMGLTNGFSHICAILAPLLVQFLVHDDTNPVEWRKVFFVIAGSSTLATIIYSIFASGKTQPWNKVQEKDSTKDNLTQ